MSNEASKWWEAAASESVKAKRGALTPCLWYDMVNGRSCRKSVACAQTMFIVIRFSFICFLQKPVKLFRFMEIGECVCLSRVNKINRNQTDKKMGRILRFWLSFYHTHSLARMHARTHPEECKKRGARRKWEWGDHWYHRRIPFSKKCQMWAQP